MTKTTIQLESATLERLRDNKIVAKESYEEVVNRALDKLDQK